MQKACQVNELRNLIDTFGALINAGYLIDVIWFVRETFSFICTIDKNLLLHLLEK